MTETTAKCASKLLLRLAPALLLAASFAMTVWLLPRLDLRPGKYPKLQNISQYGEPGEDAFFVFAREKELSHPILYYDFGTSVENAKRADILLVGNSRAQLGLREVPIAALASELGLTVFNLAVGHGDGARFGLDLIRRNDLRPKIVVVSGGPFIFNNNYSRWAAEVIEMGAWNARKTVLEITASWWFRSLLYSFLTRVEYFDDRLTSDYIHYRSSANGWWRNVLEPTRRYPVSFGDEHDSYPRALKLATEFKKEMDARGALLVLTMVPYRRTETGHLKWLHDQLGIPFVMPPFEGMETADGSHLSKNSAEQISRDFWSRLINLNVVRDRLQLREKR